MSLPTSSATLSDLPVDSYRDAAPYLRRPFTVAAIKFRVLQGKDGRANCAAYIDARLAAERLNAVCPHLWEEPSYTPVQGGMRCDLRVDGLTRSDVGWSKGTGNDMDLKALYSDAFKRAAVKFGVGVSLYALPRLVVTASAGQVKEWTKNDKTQYFLQPAGEQHLRGIYAKWLESTGVQAFGEPLDHGDVHQEPEAVVTPGGGTFTPSISAARADAIKEKIKLERADGLDAVVLAAMFKACGSAASTVNAAAVMALTEAQADLLEEALLQRVAVPA